MKQFEITAKNQSGELAKVLDPLNVNGIDIISISSERSSDGLGSLKIVTRDEENTRNVLENGGYEFKETEILTLKLSNRPGELLKFANKLGDAGVNIETIFVVGKEGDLSELALSVDKIDLARQIIG